MTFRTTVPRTTPAPATPRLTVAGLITVLLGAALAPIDQFIVNVALPTIRRDLLASNATLEWIIAAYGIMFALLLVVGGRLGDAFGRRRLFVIGLASFTITSLACGLAPNAGVLVLARALQGASAAMMVPQVLSIIQATASGEKRSKMLGFYGATGGMSMVIGQLLGGVLVSANIAGTGWRPIFLVNVPIGIAGLVLAHRTVPETRASNPLRVDRWGTLCLGVTLLLLLVPLLEGRALGWPAWCWAMLVAFPFGAIAFARVERRVEASDSTPLLPLSVLRMPSMRLGLAAAVPFFTGFGGFLFVYTLTLQDGLHVGPLGSGLALAPMAAAYLVTTLSSTRLVARFGPGVLVVGALVQLTGLIVLIGTTLLAWPHPAIFDLAPGVFICGAGQGVIAPTLFRSVLSRVPADNAGAGSGILTTTQQTCLALGVATLGSLFAGLSVPGSLGIEGAIVIVTGIQATMTAAVALLATRLPDPR